MGKSRSVLLLRIRSPLLSGYGLLAPTVLAMLMLISLEALARDLKGAAMVKSCLEKAIGSPAGKEGMSDGLRRAMVAYDLDVVEEVLTTCREAFAKHSESNETKNAHRIAVKVISVMLFGQLFDGTEADGAALALKHEAKASGVALRLLAFYLGSAYEFGRGRKMNPTEAGRWYRKAAAGGSKVAGRRLAQLQK